MTARLINLNRVESYRILDCFHHPCENPIQMLWFSKNNIETDFFWYMAQSKANQSKKKLSAQKLNTLLEVLRAQKYKY